MRGLELRGASEFPVRMAFAKLQKEREALKRLLDSTDERGPLRVEDREVALAFVTVEPE
jgi:hypothetical protein